MRPRLVAACLSVLALGGSTVLVLSLTGPSAEDSQGIEDLRGPQDPEGEGGEEGVRPALVGRQRPGATPTTQVEAWIAALRGRNTEVYAALWEIVRSGRRDLRLREPLEKLVAAQKGARRLTAMVALMQLEGSRRFMVEIAELSLKAPSAWRRHMWLTEVDPELGNAFFRAFHSARGEGLAAEDRAAFQEIADLLVSDRERGRALLIQRLQAAEGDAQLPWLMVAGGIRPLPAEYGAIMRQHIEAGLDGDTERTRLLWDEALDHSEIGPDLAAALLARLPDAVGGERGRILITLGYLACGDPPVLNALVAGFDEPSLANQHLLETFQRLGEAASPAATDVIEACRDLPDDRRVVLAETLLAMRSPDALPYFAERLRGGTEQERVHIARGVPTFPEAASLTPVLAEVARRQGSPDALRALVLLDPKLAGREAHDALREALASPITALRQEALELIPRTTWLPDDVVDAVLRRAGEWDDDVRPAAYAAIAELGRLATRGRAWIAELVVLTRREEVGLVCAALRALGEIDGNDPRVRRLLFDTIEEHDNLKRPELVSEDDFEILRAALWGLGGTDHPTPEQYLRIARMGGRYTGAKRYLLGERMRVLGNPTWERVRAEVGIKMSHRPRIRPPTWGRADGS